MRSVYYFIRLGRPIFLGGGFMLFGLGAVMAWYSGARMNLATLLGGQIAVTAIQLMTHYSNEYFDLAADTCAGPAAAGYWSRALSGRK